MAAIEKTLNRLERENPGWTRDSIWASGSGLHRFDIVLGMGAAGVTMWWLRRNQKSAK